MSIVNTAEHWKVQKYGAIIRKSEITVNREKLETIVYIHNRWGVECLRT